MWEGIRLPGTGCLIPGYALLDLAACVVFYLSGMALTWNRVDLHRHWGRLALALAFSDTVGARLFFRLLHGWGTNGFYAAPLIFACASISYISICRIKLSPLLDAWAIAFSVSHVIEKCACLSAGCCFGRPTTSGLGMAILAGEGDPTRYHPLPLYEACAHLVTALVLASFYLRGQLKGRLIILLGLIYGTWRLAVDPARAENNAYILDGTVTVTQIVCSVVVVSAIGCLWATRSWGTDHPIIGR